MDDLANFLADNTDADAPVPAPGEDGQNSDAPDEDNADEIEETDPADEDGEKPASEDAKQQPGLKFKVPVKGEDGADQTIEVDEKELVAGYQRHADYTRKTQELSSKEREVTAQVATRLQEGQTYYLQQAQMAHNAVRQLAGLRSADEMAQLASTDPAQWVQEQQRERAVQGLLSQLEQGMQRESADNEARQKQHKAEVYQKTWDVLGKEGIDRPALKKIFDTMASKYAVPESRLANIDDPILVRIMRDAAAYQDLKAAKPLVTKKVEQAPALPTARQNVPRSEQRAAALDKRFSSGKAKLNDLAAYLSNI